MEEMVDEEEEFKIKEEGKKDVEMEQRERIIAQL